MADVEQKKKMIPIITCEISLCQCVCNLVFRVNVHDLNFGIQIDSVKEQSRATLLILGTCLVVGHLPVMTF